MRKLKTLLKPTLEASAEEVPGFPVGIKVLYKPPAEADVDVVFVHGLTGDRERTWAHVRASKSWPELLLPVSFPRARILTYGYDAYFTRRGGLATLNRIRDHATDLLNALAFLRPDSTRVSRPMLIVAHSLGGLVCKDALLFSNSSSEPALRDMSANTLGIIFMGTPHTGSWMANWLKIPVKSLGVLKSTNTSLLSILQTDSEVLERLHDDFLSFIRAREKSKSKRAIEVCCFCEALPMPLIGPIVSQQSAAMPGFNKVTVHANHRDLARFISKDDSGYQALVAVLTNWLKTAQFEDDEFSDEDQLRCLQSLSFLEMDARQINIEAPTKNTCDWIKSNSTYLTWKIPNSAGNSTPVLWLKGKPGSGKSTMMRELYRARWEAAKEGKTICLGFFFNRRGADLAKSPVGLYRTLIHQLIQQSYQAMRRMVSVYKEKLNAQTHVGVPIEWSLPELRDFFHRTILELKLEPLEIFIDALDECNEDNVRIIVRSFELSALEAQAFPIDMKICWASRHYPHVSLRSGIGVDLSMEDHNDKDIAVYVRRELVLENARLQIQLGRELTRRAKGVFLWTVLVIKLLLKASDRGLQPDEMRLLLDNTPSELHDLFKEILSTLGDRTEETLAMFQWVLGAHEPLSPNALRLALVYDADVSSSSQAVGWPTSPYSSYESKQYERYIIDRSGGLLEVVASRTAPPDYAEAATNRQSAAEPHQKTSHAVQIIHESVSDFIAKGTGAQTLGLESCLNFATVTQDRLAGVCQSLLQQNWITDRVALYNDDSTDISEWITRLSFLHPLPPRYLRSVYPDLDFPLYVGRHFWQRTITQRSRILSTIVEEDLKRWSILYDSLIRTFLISGEDLLNQTHIMLELFRQFDQEAQIRELMHYFEKVFDDLLVIFSPGRRRSVEDLRQTILSARSRSCGPPSDDGSEGSM